MSEKSDYEAVTEAELKKLDTSLEQLKSIANRLIQDYQANILAKIADAERRKAEAYQRLDYIRRSGDDTWQNFRSASDSYFHVYQESIESLYSEFT